MLVCFIIKLLEVTKMRPIPKGEDQRWPYALLSIMVGVIATSTNMCNCACLVLRLKCIFEIKIILLKDQKSFFFFFDFIFIH